MTLYKNKYRVESARFKTWNYSNVGYYFITICTRESKDYLGDIKNNIMNKSIAGNIVETYWNKIPNHFENIDLDKFIVMPNHIHGIIIINSVETPIYRVSKNADILTNVKGSWNQNTKNLKERNIEIQKREEQKRYLLNKEDKKRDVINHVCTDTDHEIRLENQMKNNSLSKIIRWFKGRVTYEVNKLDKINFGWHPRFHDHIIRNHAELDRIQEYIINNPMNWEND